MGTPCTEHLGETISVQDGSPKQPSLPFTNKHPGQGIPSAGAPVPQPAAALTSDRRTCIITSYRQQETKCASHAEAERPIVINHSRPCTLDRTKTKPTVFLCWYALKTLPTISHKGPVCPALSLSQATAFGIGYGKGNSHKNHILQTMPAGQKEYHHVLVTQRCFPWAEPCCPVGHHKNQWLITKSRTQA